MLAVFPNNLIAGIFGFLAKPFFAEDAEAKKAPAAQKTAKPKVKAKAKTKKATTKKKQTLKAKVRQ